MEGDKQQRFPKMYFNETYHPTSLSVNKTDIKDEDECILANDSSRQIRSKNERQVETDNSMFNDPLHLRQGIHQTISESSAYYSIKPESGKQQAASNDFLGIKLKKRQDADDSFVDHAADVFFPMKSERGQSQVPSSGFHKREQKKEKAGSSSDVFNHHATNEGANSMIYDVKATELHSHRQEKLRQSCSAAPDSKNFEMPREHPGHPASENVHGDMKMDRRASADGKIFESYNKRPNFSDHMMTDISTYSREKILKCPVCNKAFIGGYKLNRHMKTHTGEKPYKCSLCEKAFTKNDHLNRHMITHTGNKPHKCSVCEKSFIQNYHLNRHMRTHTGEKPYQCSLCEKAFIENVHLNRHMRTHAGEIPYRCTLCDKTFTLKSHLNHHMGTHSGQNTL